MEKNIDAAIRWLCDSDIINKDRQRTSFGGVNNGYLWKEKKYQYVYNEITGYAINAFITMYHWIGEEKYLQHAIDAADYLINLQARDSNTFEYGGVCHSLNLPELNSVKKYYSFDNAIILHGMTNLYQITKEKKYYTACLDIGNFLLNMQKKNGYFYSYYDAETRDINHKGDEFFFDNGCLHVKNAIGLFYLSHISDEKRYFQAGEKICDRGQLLLEKDGLFWANNRKKYVFTHAHCYATEGYLCAYYISKNPAYLKTAQKAGEALLDLQNQDGSLYRIYKNKLFMKNQYGDNFKMSIKRWINEKKSPWKTIDATSQAARIWILLYSIDKENRFFEAAKKAVSFLQKNQVLETDDRNMFGGLFYQLCDKVDVSEVKLNRGMYTWCTQFSLSAFMLLKSVEKRMKFEDLVKILF